MLPEAVVNHNTPIRKHKCIINCMKNTALALSLSCHGKKEAGFSLVELSAVIAIAATLAMGYISWTVPATQNDALKSRLTYERMRQLTDAMQYFVVVNRRLPCPANPKLNAQRHKNSNVGATNIYDFDDEAATIDQNGMRCPVSVGAVPTRALGVSSALMFDGWGRKFLYQVAPDLCNNTDCTTRSYVKGIVTAAGGVTVKSASNTGALTLADNNAAFVLLSYGANGMGAYLPSGSRAPQEPMGTDEAENMNAEAENNAPGQPIRYIQHAATSNFDDLLTFRTQSQINSLATALTPADFISCSNNSTALSSITALEAGQLKQFVNSLEVQNGSETYNTGDIAALEVMWNLQEACYALYGDALVRACPAGQVYNQDTNDCICPKGEWSAAGCQ